MIYGVDYLLIKRILIITEHGLPVFDYKEYSRGDEVLVSGLITAILRFVEETEKEKLSRVLLEEIQYLLKSRESLLFIFQVSDEMPNEYAEYVSACISDYFVENYKEEVDDFAGNVTVFQKFHDECKDILLQCGIEIANTLIETAEGKKLTAWCLFSVENQPLVVRANAPNYNIDSFSIYQVLSKSLRKISSKINECNKGNCYIITHEGNVVQTIVLPFAVIIMESKIDELVVKKYRQFKTKPHKQIEKIFLDSFKPDKIDIYGRSLVSVLTDEMISDKHKALLDLFKAAEKGFQYLFNSPVHVQIITTDQNSTLLIKLVNRTIVLDYEKPVSTSILLEKTKKMFEQEVIIKDDIPEAVLEK